MCNILIGYWLSEDKEDKINFKQFAKFCSQNGIDLVKTELTGNNGLAVVANGVNGVNGPSQRDDQPALSLFIHKLNDLVVDAEAGDESAVARLADFERWVSYHPEVDIIDPLPFTRIMLNRVSMSRVIEKTCLALDESIYFIPPFCELATAADVDEHGLHVLRKAGLQFPIICKPIMAESHDIVVITHESGLPYAPVPCLAQTFISHYQLLFKLYILGDKLYCVERPSLPDPTDLVNMGPVLRFNTAALGKGPPSAFDPDRKKIFISDQNAVVNGNGNSTKKANGKPIRNGSSSSRCNGSYSNCPNGQSNGTNGNSSSGNSTSSMSSTRVFVDTSSICRPSPQALQVLATALRAELNMELFGADVIVDATTGRLACVDVNAFPGYKGVPDFFSELAAFLTKRARNEVSNQSQMPIYIS